MVEVPSFRLRNTHFLTVSGLTVATSEVTSFVCLYTSKQHRCCSHEQCPLSAMRQPCLQSMAVLLQLSPMAPDRTGADTKDSSTGRWACCGCCCARSGAEQGRQAGIATAPIGVLCAGALLAVAHRAGLPAARQACHRGHQHAGEHDHQPHTHPRRGVGPGLKGPWTLFRTMSGHLQVDCGAMQLALRCQ